MSREDGLWYNFMYPNGSINMTHPNSRAEFGWWAVRGTRGLAASYRILKELEPESELRWMVKRRLEACIRQVDKQMPGNLPMEKSLATEKPAGLINAAPDMTSELLLALTNLQKTGDFALGSMIQQLAKGIMNYQFRRAAHPLNGMYLCWNNVWHAWGSNQAYALLEVYRLNGDSTILQSVQLWADHFLPFVLHNNFPSEIVMQPDGSYQIKYYPQIAYGINALYTGIKELADATNSPHYAHYAEQVFDWFLGHNVARTPIYEACTGRVYDGIDPDGRINRNSGAESTIEGLRAILKSQGY